MAGVRYGLRAVVVIEENERIASFLRHRCEVVRDFFERHRRGDVRLSVNDAGATPATVSLRLDQAIEAFVSPRKADASPDPTLR